jgi:hypothetical protein
MAFTNFSGPIRSGTVREGARRNTGLATTYQIYDSGSLTGRVVGDYDVAALILPAQSQILDITVDQVTAATGGTTTISAGTSSGGAQLMAAVATTAGGRFRGVTTAETQQAWQTSITTDTTVYVRTAVAAGTLTAGRYIISVTYTHRLYTYAAPDTSPAPEPAVPDGLLMLGSDPLALGADLLVFSPA